MPRGGTLIIDRKGYVAIEFIINSMTESNGRIVYAGRFWASPEVLMSARKAAHLVIDGERITITGGDKESISFEPIDTIPHFRV